MAAGDIDTDGKLEALVDQNQEAGTYRKLVLKKNRLVGCWLFGTLERREKDISAIKDQLARFKLEGLD